MCNTRSDGNTTTLALGILSVNNSPLMRSVARAVNWFSKVTVEARVVTLSPKGTWYELCNCNVVTDLSEERQSKSKP